MLGGHDSRHPGWLRGLSDGDNPAHGLPRYGLFQQLKQERREVGCWRDGLFDAFLFAGIWPGLSGCQAFSNWLTFYAPRTNLSGMIQSFRCKDTQALYEGRHPRRFRAVAAVAVRKLELLDVAQTLAFLRSPPGNRLEALKGDRAGQYSIRINGQWRLCFVWADTGPTESLRVFLEQPLDAMELAFLAP